MESLNEKVNRLLRLQEVREATLEAEEELEKEKEERR